jgi:hypothetical protein
MTMNARSLTAAMVAAALTSVPCTFAETKAGAAAKPAAKASAAPAAAAMPQPTPAPEMAQLKPFDGSWSCAGEIPAGPMGPAQKTVNLVKTHMGMGGFWQVGTVTMSSGPMKGFEGTFNNTYDPGQKKYVMVWMDNTGGYAQQLASGWEGDKMVYVGEGSMMGQKMATRDTFTKSADGSTFKHGSEAQMEGKWVSMGEETCRKAGAAAAKK